MMSKIRKMIYAISTVILIAIGSPSVNAASYVFSQGGFPDSGVVTGSFTGEDTAGHYDQNGKDAPDGLILECGGRSCSLPYPNEITSFYIHFSGNPFFESLNNISFNYLPGAHLQNLSYDDISDKLLSLSYGDIGGVISYYTNGKVGQIATVTNTYPFDIHISTTEPITVSQVPLPGALGLFIPCLAWLGIIRRKGKELIMINSAIDDGVGANGNAVRFLS